MQPLVQLNIKYIDDSTHVLYPDLSLVSYVKLSHVNRFKP